LQIIKTCESFANNKNLVTLVKPGTGYKQISIKKFYGLKENIIIKEFSSIKKFPQGINFYLYSFYCLFYILKKKKPIIITRNYFICYLLLLFRKKVVLEVHHDTNVEGKVIKFLLKYTNFLNKKNLINIIAISNSVKNLFIKKYLVEDKKITVLPSGSSIKINNFRKNLYNQRFKIGYFGSISPSKGIKTIIKLSKIDHKNDYYIFGGNKKEIQKLRTQNTNRNLFFNEHVLYKFLPEKMMAMDFLTIPYTKNVNSSGEVDDISKYTSPLKLFDYLAIGKVIISSNLQVLREVIGHKNSYFVDNFENIFEWKKIIEIAKNNKVKNLIICKNNSILSKKFDHAIRVRRYL
jgi:glycosyltransferase involved in cell wall biosynthesis